MGPLSDLWRQAGIRKGLVQRLHEDGLIPAGAPAARLGGAASPGPRTPPHRAPAAVVIASPIAAARGMREPNPHARRRAP